MTPRALALAFWQSAPRRRRGYAAPPHTCAKTATFKSRRRRRTDAPTARPAGARAKCEAFRAKARSPKDFGRALNEPAVPRGVRPRVEAAARAVGLLGDPHLLEGRPVLRRALRTQEDAAVVLLEADVHLQAAVVRGAVVPPRALVAVDAQPGASVRRTGDEAPSERDGTPPPDLPRAPEARMLDRAEPRAMAHHGPQPQGRAAVVPDRSHDALVDLDGPARGRLRLPVCDGEAQCQRSKERQEMGPQGPHRLPARQGSKRL